MDKPIGFPRQIFRANDIRGVADTELSDRFAQGLGSVFAQKIRNNGEDSVMVCRDARLSSSRLEAAIVKGLLSEKIAVTDLGIGPTPLLGFTLACSNNIHSGVMVTASHNPKEQNGFKLSLGGMPLFGEELMAMYEDINNLKANNQDDYPTAITALEAVPNYLQAITADIAPLQGLKVVVDGANGAAGPLAIRVLDALGAQVIPQFCILDGNFPNRSPDTSQAKNLKPLQDRVIAEGADVGIGFDGDGDRVVFVTEKGRLLDADDVIGVFAESALANIPRSRIIYDVKCSSSIGKKITSKGGTAIMDKSGRSYLQTRMFKEEASFAGEYSAHYFFNDRWAGTDDGIYAACRLLEISKTQGLTLEQICPPVSGKVATGEIYLKVPEAEKFQLVDTLRQQTELEINGEKPTTILIDGLRLEYESGWALVRASNTAAALTLRFEAVSEPFMKDLKAQVCGMLKRISPELDTDGIKNVA